MRMVRGIAVGVALILASGCWWDWLDDDPFRACTLMACVEGVTIDLEREWEPGHHRFVVEADGETATCIAPWPPTEPSHSLCQRASSDSLRASLDPEFRHLWVSGTPEELALRVERDTEVVLSRTIRPVYESEEINGPGCGWCTTGRALVSDE